MNIIRHLMLCSFFLVGCFTATAQSIKGRTVERTEKGEQPLPSVTVYWLHTNTATVTDEAGGFVLPLPPVFPANLVFSLVGYKADTIVVTGNDEIHVVMQGNVNLKEINVERR